MDKDITVNSNHTQSTVCLSESASPTNVPVHPHFPPSSNNLPENIKSTDMTRIQSTTKMSSRGPVKQEFTLKGSTPSGKPRLFVCGICTRAFARQEHLSRHERSHTKEKPFTCNICSRKFSRRDLLLRHSTKLHAGAADVIPRLRKRSIKHMKKEELEGLDEKDLTGNSNKKSRKSITSISTAPTSIISTASNINGKPNAVKSLTPSSTSSSSSSSNHNKKNNSSRHSDDSENSLILETSSKGKSKSPFSKSSNKNYEDEKSILNTFQLPLYPMHSMGDFSDIASSLVTIDNINDNDNDNENEHSNFNRFNELQSNSYNYYRRASFSAMSGNNYAMTNPEPYATETVEFSTPQFYSIEDEQERWLNSISETNEAHFNQTNPKMANPNTDSKMNSNTDPIQVHRTEIEQLSDFMRNKKLHDQNNGNHIQNYGILNGYSFYDNNTNEITETLFKTRLTGSTGNIGNSSPKKYPQPQPFKSTSPIMQEELLNLNSENNNNNKNVSNPMKLNNDIISQNYQKSNLIKNLFDKFSKTNTPINSSKINVLDKLNLEQLEQLIQGHGFSSIANNNNKNNIHNGNNNINNNDDDLMHDIFNGDLSSKDGINDKVRHWQETLFNQPIADLEKLNDMHVSNTYGIPQGYSFYGGGDEINDLNRSSSNGILGNYNNDDNLSSEATISPVLLESNIDDNQMDIDKEVSLPHEHHDHEHKKLSFEEKFDIANLSSYSQAFLFTNNMKKIVKQSLHDYPFFGTPTPELVSNDLLNLYVDQFINKFLTHHPFIHKSILNEYWIIKNSRESAVENSISVKEAEDYDEKEFKIVRDNTFLNNFEVSIVCLPLLIATIGAVVSNKKEDAANLYEISRRCIHVYLESRRNLKTVGDDSDSNSSVTSPSSSPLWLIQSLTLSVIYGLFADEEISLSVIIRQVHALNALVKSSGINDMKRPPRAGRDFKIYLSYESTIRTIHMIFHVSTLLSTLYNIVPSLSLIDVNIDLPGASLLWECLNEEEYVKLVENFDFGSKGFKFVLKELFRIDIKDVNMKTGLINNNDDNFLLNNHVSEFGLICLQNALHQLVYFSQLESEKQNVKINHSNISRQVLQELGDGSEISMEKIKQVGEIWNLLVNACVLYNKSSEVYSDCKILNHYLNLKLSSIMNLNKIKESVWLKSFSDINEQYIKCFNYGDDELKDIRFQDELIALIDNSINILKLIFFNEDNSLIGTISPSFKLNNETMKKLDNIYATPPPNVEDDNYEYSSLNRINLNVLHKLSIDSQVLFDVILIIVKFLINYENFFKIRMKFNTLTNYTFLQHFELSSTIFSNFHDGEKMNKYEKSVEEFDKILFKYYLKFFKIFLNLEEFLKHNYNYEDFETGEALEALNNLYPNIKNNNDIDKILNESQNKFYEEGKNLNGVVSDELIVFHDRDLIMSELVSFKLPFKFLKMGGFLFGFVYDKNFKFVNFKHLSDVLFHLRIFLESKDEYV